MPLHLTCFLMTEACYYNKGNTQYEIFMFGIHKAMIWVLSLVCVNMSNLTYEKDGITYHGAVPFGRYDFSAHKGSPKEQILALAKKVKFWTDPIEQLPDIDMNYKVNSKTGA